LSLFVAINLKKTIEEQKTSAIAIFRLCFRLCSKGNIESQTYISRWGKKLKEQYWKLFLCGFQWEEFSQLADKQL